jgi:hypothetical protein
MAVQYETALRTAQGTQWETSIGASPKVQVRTGTQPANCAAASTGTLIAEWSLAADFATQSAGAVTLSGLPLTTTAANANAGGTLHYRIMDSAGTTCKEQGSVSVAGGGGDMEIDSLTVAAAQTMRITAYTKTFPGA